MKSKNTSILCAVLLIVFASISCIFPGPATEPAPLKIDPDSLLDAQTGVAYEAEIRVSQNITPVYIIYISSGALPAGLTLTYVERKDVATITGIPTESGTFTFTISVHCLGTMRNGQVGEKEYTLLVK
jgi:hypothetical protein